MKRDATALPAPGSTAVWLLAARPRTLPAAVAPVMIGTAMAFGDGALHGPAALAAFVCAVLIQIATNLANDLFDFEKGADTESRLGPKRVTQAGLVSPGTMRRGIAAVLALTLAMFGGVFDHALPPDIERTLQGEHPVDDVVRHRAHDDFAIAQRTAHWAAGWRMFQDRPLLGVGAGNFDDAYRAFALQPFDEPLGHAHNVPLNFGAEAGLPGMLMFAGLSLWAFGIAVAAVRRARGTAFEWSAVGALGALVGLATHNLVDSLFVSGMGIVFALILALLLVVPARPRGAAMNARRATA